MLVLSRKMDQEIVIGDQIRITVLQVKGDKVKLGIQAGDHVKILRGELLQGPANPLPPAEPERGHAILDPTAGLCEDEPADDNAPSGARGSNLFGPDHRPAWLTICCCS